MRRAQTSAARGNGRRGDDFSTLKTWDFKTPRRISSDPIADNRIWDRELRSELTKDLSANGLTHATGERADFLVAYYVGLKETYDVRRIDYGYPGFLGRRRFGWAWGWPNDMDISRGYDTIDMKTPDARLDKVVDNVVKKFLKDRDDHS